MTLQTPLMTALPGTSLTYKNWGDKTGWEKVIRPTEIDR